MHHAKGKGDAVPGRKTAFRQSKIKDYPVLRGRENVSVTSDLLRGNTDTIILATLSEGDSYGYEISRRIARLSEGELTLKEATLYCAFKRLQEAGLIASYWGDEGAGARRRYYTLTEEGKITLQRQRKEWQTASAVLSQLILGKDGTPK